MRHNGSARNTTTMSGKAMLAGVSKCDVECGRILREVETSHGRQVLNDGYSKLVRLIDLCAQEAEPFKHPVNECDLISWNLSCGL